MKNQQPNPNNNDTNRLIGSISKPVHEALYQAKDLCC